MQKQKNMKYLANWLKRLSACAKRKIYTLITNGYDSIVIDKEPIKSREGNNDEGQRVIYTKYKDTYMDGHVEYHEEGVAIEIAEKRLKSKSSYYSRKYDHITEVYDVVYVDGKIGQIVKKYTEYAD